MLEYAYTLFTGEAADWYWEYAQGNPDAQWPDLRDALRDQFRDRLPDIDLWVRIRSRTQKDHEPFAKFFKDNRGLVCRLQQPPKEAELLETLHRSLRPEIMRAIFPIDITTIRELHECVEKFEKQEDRLAVRRLVKFSVPKRHLSEVETVEPFLLFSSVSSRSGFHR